MNNEEPEEPQTDPSRTPEIKYPLAKETINEKDIDDLCNWLKTYPRLTKGNLTLEVEKKWAEYIGTRFAVFNNSPASSSDDVASKNRSIENVEKSLILFSTPPNIAE